MSSIFWNGSLIAAVVAATVLYASVVEWFFHRTVYHRWFWPQHAEHHAAYDGAGFRQPGGYHSLQPWWLEAGIVTLHLPVALLLGRATVWGAGVALLVTLSAVAALSNYLHTVIHCPNGRWLERTRWYRRMVVRHRAHHDDDRYNFNIPFAFGDRAFGTFTVTRADRAARRSPAPYSRTDRSARP